MKKRYALLLANPEYREGKFAHLPLPGEGSDVLAAWLRNPDGGGFQSVEVVTGSTMSQTVLAIERFFGNKNPEDLLLVWFGGHAIVDSQGDAYLCLRDSDRLRLKSTAIMAGVLAMHMDASAALDKLLVLDCRFHAFTGHRQEDDPKPALRLERAFTGRGNGKHILAADSVLHLHSHLDAEGALKPVGPFTRAFTAIWREQSEELQGLTLSDLYPALCRRLGNSSHPEWFKVGQATDLVLAPAARTELVAALGPQDHPERMARDLDSLDWDRLSGEIPLDILGLGLGGDKGRGKTGSGEGPKTPSTSGPLPPPLPPENPRPHADSLLEEEPGSEGEAAALKQSQGESLEEPPTSESPAAIPESNQVAPVEEDTTETQAAASILPPAAIEPQASVAASNPATAAQAREPDAKPTAGPIAPGAAYPSAPPPISHFHRLNPNDVLHSATISMPSQEALEVMGETANSLAFTPLVPMAEPELPPLNIPDSPANGDVSDLINATMMMVAPSWNRIDPETGELPSAAPTTGPEDSVRAKLQRQMEEEARREQEEKQRQENEWKTQAEALKKWKTASLHSETKPAPSEKPGRPADAAKVFSHPPGGWMSPDVQQTQRIDADVAEALRDAAEAPTRADTPAHPPARPFKTPVADDKYAATLMYVQEDADNPGDATAPAESPMASSGVQATSAPPQARSTSEHSAHAVEAWSRQAAPPFSSSVSRERPPADLNLGTGLPSGLSAPRFPWPKIALLIFSMLLPLALAAFLLSRSGLFDRLRAGSRGANAPAEVLEASAEVTANAPRSASPRDPIPAQSPESPQPIAVRPAPAPPPSEGLASAPAPLPQPVHVPAKAMAPPSAKPVKRIPRPQDEQDNRDLKGSLQKAAGRESEHLSRLFERYRLGYPNLGGIVNVRLEISSDGRIRSAKCVSSTTSNPAFDEDVARSTLGWKLTEYRGNITKFVTVPLRFPLNTP